MKKLLLILLSSFALVGCIDNEYDIDKITTDGLTFGDKFAAPIGNVKLKLNDLLDFNANNLKSNNVMVSIPETFNSSFELNGGFDQGIVDALTNSGSQSIEIEVIHPIPNITLTLNLSFFFDKEETPIITDMLLSSAGNKATFSVNATKDVLTKIASAKSLSLNFKVSKGANSVISLNPNDIVTINLTLKRIGGIKF